MVGDRGRPGSAVNTLVPPPLFSSPHTALEARAGLIELGRGREHGPWAGAQVCRKPRRCALEGSEEWEEKPDWKFDPERGQSSKHPSQFLVLKENIDPVVFRAGGGVGGLNSHRR